MRGGTWIWALAVAACSKTQASDVPPRAPQPVEAPVATLAPLFREGGPLDVAPAPDPGATVDVVAFTPRGTLVGAGRGGIVVRAPDGTVKREKLPKDAVPHVSNETEGVAFDTGSEVTLLATPSLAPLFTGKATALDASSTALALQDERAVVVQHEGKLLKLALPADAPKDAEVENLVPVAGGKRYDLTLKVDGIPARAALYDTDGKLVGRGILLPRYPTTPPKGEVAGNVGFAIDGSRVARVDLLTGAVLKQATVRCGKDEELANPTSSPAGDLLLVTCALDGVVLDGVTLAERRRIPRVVPGCDNGLNLAGTILPDGHTLHLEGCGGESRLDLSTGSFACGDDIGLLGAPYDPGPGGHRVPSGREHVKRCNPPDRQYESPFGTSGRYRLVTAEKTAITFAGGKIELEEGSGLPVAAPGDGSFAYARGGEVVVRGLPDGAVRATLALRP